MAAINEEGVGELISKSAPGVEVPIPTLPEDGNVFWVNANADQKDKNITTTAFFMIKGFWLF